MKSIDKMIADAKKALEATEKDSSERAAAQAKLDALNSVKEAGIGFTQDDLNRVDRKTKEGYEASIKDVLGMTLEEAKQVMADVEGSLLDDGDGEGEDPKLSKLVKTLDANKTEVGNLRTSGEEFQRRYYTERVTNRLQGALKGAGLQEKYLTPAQRLASYDELIEKSMKGEEVPDERFAEIANSVKEASPVWFEPERNDDYPDIPRTPEGDPPEQVTDQQRAERSAPVF